MCLFTVLWPAAPIDPVMAAGCQRVSLLPADWFVCLEYGCCWLQSVVWVGCLAAAGSHHAKPPQLRVGSGSFPCCEPAGVRRPCIVVDRI
jgi:hypothetical protein